MEQEHKIMTMESRIKDVEVEQANVRDHVNRMVDSQEKQTMAMSKNTAAIMVMCEKIDTSTEIGKKALDKVDLVAISVVRLETKESERIRTEKTYFIGMLIVGFGACAGAAKAFGVI